jgi:hypothetical protein
VVVGAGPTGLSKALGIPGRAVDVLDCRGLSTRAQSAVFGSGQW